MSTQFERSAYFFFQNEDKELLRIQLADGIMFGRREDCEVVIEDDRVSGQHFQVHLTNGMVYIEDLDSVNKTYVNGQFIDPLRKRLLKEGDVISVGGELYGFSHNEKLSFKLPDKERKKAMTITNISSPSSLDLDMSGSHLVDHRKESKRLLNQLTESKRLIKGLEEEKVSLSNSRNEMGQLQNELSELVKEKISCEDELEDENVEVEEIQKRIEHHKLDIEDFHKNITLAEAQIEKLKKKIIDYQENIEDREVRLQNLYDEMGVFAQYAKLLKSIDQLESKIHSFKDPEEKLAEIEKTIKHEKSRYKQCQKEYGEAVAMARSTGVGRGRKSG